MNKKIIPALLLSGGMALMLSGCSCYMGVDTNIKSSGSGTFSMITGYTKDYYENMIGEVDLTEDDLNNILSEMDSFTFNGETYYGQQETASFSSTYKLEKMLTDPAAFQKSFPETTEEMTDSTFFDTVYASTDTFYAYPAKNDLGDLPANMSTAGASEQADFSAYIRYTITFPKKVVSSNGQISADKHTVSWDANFLMKGKALYATTEKTPKKITVNVKKGKLYNKAVTIKSQGKGSLYLDGKLIRSGHKVSTNGKHKLVMLGQNRKKTSLSFTIDTKAPVIRGAKNNKVYNKKVKLTIKDAVSGIKSVTVNGKALSDKQIKNGYTIKKPGKYKVVATDKANNKRIIRFQIK